MNVRLIRDDSGDVVDRFSTMTAFDEDLEFNLDDLSDLFGAPLGLSNPELLDYWFRYTRPDGISISLSFSGYERSVSVIVTALETVACSHMNVDRCDAIRVLEPERRTFEILASRSGLRCFVALDGDSILSSHIHVET